MPRGRTYRFVITAYSPETIPMVRLAEYMRDLGVLLGEETSVHFERLEPGSTAVINRIDEEAVPKVHHRVRSVYRGDGPVEAMRAYNQINHRLANDNATGSWGEIDSKSIIQFPGIEAREPVTFGAFNQEGSLDGTLIRLGGRDEWVPVHLQSGGTIYSRCKAQRELAQRMATHIFRDTLRVYGTGRWYRDEDGVWVLERFTIKDYEQLDDAPLSEVVGRLRNIPDSGWLDIDDPIGELRRLRRGNDDLH